MTITKSKPQNAKVFTVYGRLGLVHTTAVEATGDEFGRDLPTNGRFVPAGNDDICVCSVVPKAETFALRHYESAAAKHDRDLHHAVRHARQAVRGGRVDRRQVKLAHVAGNIMQFLAARDMVASRVAAMLGPGWWQRGISGTKSLAELAGLLRSLDRVAFGPAGDTDESPFADADNGQMAYSGPNAADADSEDEYAVKRLSDGMYLANRSLNSPRWVKRLAQAVRFADEDAAERARCPGQETVVEIPNKPKGK